MPGVSPTYKNLAPREAVEQLNWPSHLQQTSIADAIGLRVACRISQEAPIHDKKKDLCTFVVALIVGRGSGWWLYQRMSQAARRRATTRDGRMYPALVQTARCNAP